MAVGFFRGSRLDLRCAVVVAAAMVCRISIADAAMIPVNSTADDTAVNGNCTVREAVIAANTNPVGTVGGSGAKIGPEEPLTAAGLARWFYADRATRPLSPRAVE